MDLEFSSGLEYSVVPILPLDSGSSISGWSSTRLSFSGSGWVVEVNGIREDPNAGAVILTAPDGTELTAERGSGCTVTVDQHDPLLTTGAFVRESVWRGLEVVEADLQGRFSARPKS